MDASAGDRLDFRILGPVEVAQNGERLELGGEKQRALLALLLLHANEVVARDTIIDALWGDRPPPTAPAALNVYVSKLRKALGATPDMLATRDPGYVLSLEPGQLDVDRFAELAAEGKRALDVGDYKRAEWTLKGADSLFRGRPLADLSHEDFAQRASARLEESRLEALMDRIDAELAQGRGSGLVVELERLVGEHPLQERLWAQLMHALYASGRHADALDAFQRARRALDELGIQPSPELRLLHAQILRHDPALQPSGAKPPRAAAAAPRRRALPRRRVWASVAAFLLIAAIFGVLLARRDGDAALPPAAAANSVRVIDIATSRPVGTVPLGGPPGGIAYGLGAVWAANVENETLLRIDPTTMKVVQTVGVPGISDVAVGAGAVWVMAGYGSEIVRIRPDAPELRRVIPILRHTSYEDPSIVANQIAIGAGSVWALESHDAIARIDASSARIVSRISLRGHVPEEIVFGGGALWVGDQIDRRLIRVDPHTERAKVVATYGEAPSGIAVADGSVWAGDYSANILWRFNVALGRAERTFGVGQGPGPVAAGAGFVWVGNTYDGTVTKVDPEANRVLRLISVVYVPTRIVVGEGKLWVTIR